ncbi:ABC transporter permease [Actinomadura sp. NBRC 104412]|uniref:ABC transporter permease n=1 Tax=Actinomadura sp. NBRC 104412 TaxID=3032203 RepID=UPI0024A40279|nr:ABC transporter permease [Actinomadura sp. NBRC 104412]GLZ07940.1 ABC transporter permease [Actinomadura sp. NBRC 104412]
MIRLIGAELLKIRSTRMWLGMLALSLGFSLMSVAVYIAFAGMEVNGEQGIGPVTDPDTVRALYASSSAGVLFMMILGIMGITGEYRHQTITGTFLLTPRRGRLLVAKLISYFLFGAAFGLATVLVTAVVAVIALAIRGGPTNPLEHDVPLILGGAVLAMALYSLVGLGLGALIRNQIAAIIVAVGWVQLVEGILTVALPEVGQWLPAGAVRAVTLTSSAFGGSGTLDTLPAWGGALLLLAYGLAFAAIAMVTTVRRDIT